MEDCRLGKKREGDSPVMAFGRAGEFSIVGFSPGLASRDIICRPFGLELAAGEIPSNPTKGIERCG